MMLTQKVSSTSILLDISFSYVMCPMYIRLLSPAVKSFFPELFPQELPDAGAGLSVLCSWSSNGDERGRGNEDCDTITCVPDPRCTSQYPIYLSGVKREFINENVGSGDLRFHSTQILASGSTLLEWHKTRKRERANVDFGMQHQPSWPVGP